MNALTTTKPASLLMDPGAFDHMQRVGRMLAMSPLFPEHLRKGSTESAVANGVLVMNMAARLNEDPLTVAQNIYFVGGKPGWGASYMIAKANQHGVFKNPIDWTVTGSGETLSVTAFAELAATGKTVEVTCDMAMAKAEGWTKNTKYQSMPEQMLRYRSATFLIRLYCPEVMVGVPAAVEVELDMKDVTPDYGPRVVTPNDGPVVEATAEPAKAATTPAEPEAKPAPAPQAEPKAASKSEPEQKAEAQTSMFENGAPDGVDMEQFRLLYDRIVGDLLDAGADEVTELYAAQIEQMRVSAPDLHRNLQAEIEASRA